MSYRTVSQTANGLIIIENVPVLSMVIWLPIAVTGVRDRP
jgi:hypothetical protein